MNATSQIGGSQIAASQIATSRSRAATDGYARWYASWYGALALGLTPLAVAGFGVSAIANRPVFALWSLASVIVFTASLHRVFAAGWSGPRRLAAALAVQAGAWLAFGWLVARHHEALDLGLRAFAPALQPLWPASPWTPLVLSTVLGIVLAVSSIALWRTRR